MSNLLNPFRFGVAPSGGTPPAFHSVSSFNVGGIAIGAGWQTGHAVDDTGLLFTVVRKDQPDTTDFASLGWTDLGLAAPAGTNSRRIRALWKRATSTSEPTATMNDSGALNGICLMNVRGCRTTGAPVALLQESSGSGASNQVTIPSGTTTGNDRLVAIAATQSGDTDISQLVSFVNANLSSITVRVETQSSFGVGVGLYVFTAERAIAAALGDTIMNTIGTAPDFHAAAFEFIP